MEEFVVDAVMEGTANTTEGKEIVTVEGQCMLGGGHSCLGTAGNVPRCASQYSHNGLACVKQYVVLAG